MVKAPDEPTDDRSRWEPAVAVNVQISTSPDEPKAKIAIALPMEPNPSNYIPMESHVLVAKLSRRFSEVEASRILKLDRRIGLRCALRLEDTFSKADYLYSVFNPDSDPISEEAHLPSRTPENLEAFKVDLENMLDMAGFQPVPEEFITVSKAADGLRGFKVTLPPPEALKLKLYYQRLVPTIVRSTSNPYFLRTYFPVHDTSGVWQFEISRCINLIGCFHGPERRFRTVRFCDTPGALCNSRSAVQPKPSLFQRICGCCWPSKPATDEDEGSSSGALLSGEPQAPPEPPLHLRIFRSVSVHNADMLLPGAVASFTLFDKLFIFVPVIIGLCCALYKIHNSTLTFSPKEHPVAFVTTLALVLMPLTYAARVRMSMQRKADNYKADIDEMLLMRQRSSNTGALQWLLDKATAQEQKEMLLAYTFLWDGKEEPQPVARATAKSDVDAAIERFLMDDILQAESGNKEMARLDFDMADALGDVVKAGIVREVGDGDMLQAVPLSEAVDLMSIRNYPEESVENRAVGVARKWLQCTKRRMAIAAQHAAEQPAAAS